MGARPLPKRELAMRVWESIISSGTLDDKHSECLDRPRLFDCELLNVIVEAISEDSEEVE